MGGNANTTFDESTYIADWTTPIIDICRILKADLAFSETKSHIKAAICKHLAY